jgi:hypothetical protein
MKKPMNKTVQKRFYEDPEWYQIEELIKEYINPLLDMSTVDTTQPAEHVKAEIIGRRLAHDSLSKFVEQSKLIGQAKKPDPQSPYGQLSTKEMSMGR